MHSTRCKPVERQGRKASGLRVDGSTTAGLPVRFQFRNASPTVVPKTLWSAADDVQFDLVLYIVRR
jgi:hypothetical protein